MSEVALYRKYRPKKFSEVVGQEHVIKALTGALEEGKAAHAYLFSGPRGTGKTSVARILAAELKCHSNDLYEIDGASNRGIDDVRELREAVRTLPFESPVKVYIIDEVHMLTTAAFNALLKTLEEPPEHVVFILATTATLPELPETIVSRCQTFIFKQPTVEILRKHVEKIAKKEGYEIEKEAADLVAFVGDGSYRDTLGILQKAIAFSSDKKIIAEEIRSVIGIPNNQLVSELTEAVISQDLERALAQMHIATENNLDINLITRLLLRELRLLMLLKYSPLLKKPLIEELGEAKLITAEDRIKRAQGDIPSVVQELLLLETYRKNSYLPELPLQLALIKTLGPKSYSELDGK